MGNSRSIRRSIACHPVNVWRAKRKAALTVDAIKTPAFTVPTDLPTHVAFVNPAEKAAEVNQILTKEN